MSATLVPAQTKTGLWELTALSWCTGSPVAMGTIIANLALAPTGKYRSLMVRHGVITPTSNPFSSSSSNVPSYGPRLCGRWSWINSRIVSRGVCLLDSGLKLIINLRVFLFRELNPVVVIRKPLLRLFTILSTPHSQRERSVPRISPCLHRLLTLLPWRGSIYNSIFNVIH